MHLTSIIGTRPQLIKVASLTSELSRRHIRHSIIDTGQHYDSNLSNIFFNELEIPTPDFNLSIGSNSRLDQIGKILIALNGVMKNFKTDGVLIYGDTNSTLAGALTVSELKLPLIHIESGLRSRNRCMPEEQNRIVADHLSDLLLCPNNYAKQNLAEEGIVKNVVVTGDITKDIFIKTKNMVEGEIKTAKIDKFILCSIHRGENTDQRSRLMKILTTLNDLDTNVYLLLHPRLKARMHDFKIELKPGSIIFKDPVGYFALMELLITCTSVITDSGGLQKEAFWIGKKCTTLRNETEWVETLQGNQNMLVTNLDELTQIASRENPKFYATVLQDSKAVVSTLDEITKFLSLAKY
jgi:UDP-N-acetylglucosamine 2-epimerase